MNPTSPVFEIEASIARAHAESVTLETVCCHCLKKCALIDVTVRYIEHPLPDVCRTESRSACCRSGYIYEKGEKYEICRSI